VGFRRHPTYVRKARNGYQLQRGVPKDLQPLLGKKVWVEPGGATYQEAHRRSPAFAARTDRDIAIARGEQALGPEELTDALPKTYVLADQALVAALDEGASVDVEEDWITQVQTERYRRVLHGQEPPREPLTGEEFVELASQLKSPAERTRRAWRSALEDFLSFAEVRHPTAATREQAINYRTHILSRLSPSTVKVRLAYLGGLWSVLHELRPEREHIFAGLNRRIKLQRPRKEAKEAISIPSPEAWAGNEEHLDILNTLYFTGARLSEACGLLAEDILDDRIIIRPNKLRPLKTVASEREIPLHPKLKETARKLRIRKGLLWPKQFQDCRWGVNLSKPCKKITGISPKGLRDRAVTVLRQANVNEAVAARLLGHTPSWLTTQYGGVAWEKLVEAVELL
jgi:integrase